MITKKKLRSALRLLAKGEFRNFGSRATPFVNSLRAAPRFYLLCLAKSGGEPRTAELATDHPVAVESLDTKIPFGAAKDNSTNRAFIMKLHDIIVGRIGKRPCSHAGSGL